MPFFARPDLSNEQFKQLSGSTLTLSGTTQIAKIDGLTLVNNSIGTTYPNIIITAENADAHVGDVLTYDGAGKIKLSPSGSGGDPIYPITCKSPASVTLCGISAGFILTGKTLSNILETLLVPTLSPTKIEPSSTFCLCCSPTGCTGYYEIGSTISLTSISTFSRGCVNPVYCSGPSVRSGYPTAYCYTVPTAVCPLANFSVSCSGTGYTHIFGAHIISATESYTNKVFYSSGQTILNSAGSGATFTTTCTCNPLPAGSTPNITRTINATYPYFYGKITDTGSRPAVTNALVISGNKVVYPSTGTVTVSFNSNTNEYTWIAIPTICGTTKKCWYVNALDNGFMNRGCVSDKYPDECVFCVTCGSWCINYMVYMSGTVGQITNPMEFRNS